MGHMNDFFGEPIFQPTGTDWIDHAFTAAILDEMEADSDTAAPEYQPSASAPTPEITPEVQALLDADPEYQRNKRILEAGAAETEEILRRAWRKWF